MKHLFVILLISAFSLNIFAQSQNEEATLYKKKIESYSKMKKNGTGLILGGSFLTAAGIAGISSGLNSWDQTSVDLGSAGLSLGVTAIVGGIIFRSIGNRKVKEYTDKLNNLDLSYNYNLKQPVFTLVYKF